MFGKNSELPDELKALGLTPAEIAKAISDKKELENKVSALEMDKKKAEDSLNNLNSSFETVKAKLAEIEASHSAPQQDQGLASFLDDEDRAFAQRNAPTHGLAVQANIQLAKLRARQILGNQTKEVNGQNLNLGRLFDKFDSEIDGLAKMTPAAALINPETWDHLFHNVLGRHTTEILSNPSGFVEPASSNAISQRDDNTQKDRLTPEEERIAARMRVKPEDFLKSKKETVILGI
jgi:hypothetical protein